MKYLPIQGTGSWYLGIEGYWWQPDSPFSAMMRSEGFQILNPERPFIWSTDLNGHHGWRRWFRLKRDTDHRDWQAGGAGLLYYLDGGGIVCRVPYGDRNLIAHSHGLQVVLYACSMGLQIRRLISVGSPIRDDMKEEMAAAVPNIGFWLHLHDKSDDHIQLAGSFGDGKAGRLRSCKGAHMNIGLSQIGHSKLLNPEGLHIWKEDKLLEYFRLPLSVLKGHGSGDGPEFIAP